MILLSNLYVLAIRPRKLGDDAADSLGHHEGRDRVGGVGSEQVVVEMRVLVGEKHERRQARAEICTCARDMKSAFRQLRALLIGQTVQLARNEPAVLVLDPNRRARGPDQRRRQLDDALEDVFEARGRGKLASELEQLRRTLRLAARRLVEARILDRHGGVAREHLEQSNVVLVELVQTELRDDNHACDARAVAQRHGDERLLDRRRPGNARSELAVRGVVNEQGLPRLGAAARDTGADLRAEQLQRQRHRLDDELASERDGNELLAVDDEHATVVVIDQGAQLGGDLVSDLADVVEAVELAAQALEHLHVGDRADVALMRRCVRAFARLFVVENDSIFPARLRRHHRRLGARGQLTRVHRVLRAE